MIRSKKVKADAIQNTKQFKSLRIQYQEDLLKNEKSTPEERLTRRTSTAARGGWVF